jgi:hypothetical protein
MTGDEYFYKPKILTDVISISKFRYFGKMIGWALNQSEFNLPLDLNPLFWKRILNKKITFDDLKEIDL